MTPPVLRARPVPRARDLLFRSLVNSEHANSLHRARQGAARSARATTQPSDGAVADVTEPSPRAALRPHDRSRPQKHARMLLAGLLAIAWSPAVEAIVVSGGGSRTSDCLAVFSAHANRPARRPRHIRCTDGDPCDADGMANGQCVFPVAACINSTLVRRCSLTGVETLTIEHAEDNGDPDFDPDFQALQARIDADLAFPSSAANRCTLPATIQVPIRGPFRNNRCKKGKKRIRMRAVSTLIDERRVRVDRDDFKLTCVPSPLGCSPRQFFASTFDRVQRQILNQTCAVSACHDSQAVAGELLLETGASHANLVGITPSNGPAGNAGWHRIAVPTPGTGDLERSYLLHKIAGDLPAGFGARMPLGGRKLDRTLIDVITLWIAAGAPEDGWVPGTD